MHRPIEVRLTGIVILSRVLVLAILVRRLKPSALARSLQFEILPLLNGLLQFGCLSRLGHLRKDFQDLF